MKNVLRLAIVDPSDSTRDALKSLTLGMEMVWLEAECSRYEFFSDVVKQAEPDIAMVALDSDPEKALQLVATLGSEAPNCSILVVSSSSEGSLILQAMRAGAKEFLTQPVSLEDLVAALERIASQRFGGDMKGRSCVVIAVAGATGGVGTTSLAVNLGATLAADKENTVVLVDLDLCLGDADVFLDMIPDYTLVDLAQNVTRLDFTMLKRSLTRHPSGLFLLPRPIQMEDVSLVAPEDLNRVIGLFKASFSHLVIDLSKSYGPLDAVALKACDHVLLVTQLDLPCLRNVVRLMMSFAETEGLLDKIKIVVNRVGLETGHITLKKAQDTIGREIFAKLPNDYQAMVEARNNGVPLLEQAPKAKITQAIIDLANTLTGNDQSSNGGSQSSKSSFGRLIGIWGGKSASENKE